MLQRETLCDSTSVSVPLFTRYVVHFEKLFRFICELKRKWILSCEKKDTIQTHTYTQRDYFEAIIFVCLSSRLQSYKHTAGAATILNWGCRTSGPIRFLPTHIYVCVCVMLMMFHLQHINIYTTTITSNLTSNIDIHHYMAYYFAIVVSTEVNIMTKVYFWLYFCLLFLRP